MDGRDAGHDRERVHQEIVAEPCQVQGYLRSMAFTSVDTPHVPTEGNLMSHNG